MDKIDQVLWEQELREHLDRDADERDPSSEFAEFTTLAELNRDADSRERAEFREHQLEESPVFQEPAAGSSEPDVVTARDLKDLETLIGLEELDRLEDTPRAEPPYATHRVYFMVSVLLMSLLLVAGGSVGYSVGYFAI